MSPFPGLDRFLLPPYVAAIASLQEWDALMHFSYAVSAFNNESNPSNWHAYNDPAMLALMPATALLFRQDHVAQARQTYQIDLTPNQIFGQPVSPKTSRAIRTLTEQSKLQVLLPAIKELSWLETTPVAGKEIKVSDPDRDFIPIDQHTTCSDTKEFCRNWTNGIYTIDTPRSQIAAGQIGGREITLQDVLINVSTKYASFAVRSLDRSSILRSKNLLISMATQSVPVKPNKLSFLSEPVTGEIRKK